VLKVWIFQTVLGAALGPVYVVYLVRVLQVPLWLLAAVGTFSGGGALLGSRVVRRLRNTKGIRFTAVIGAALLAVSSLGLLCTLWWGAAARDVVASMLAVSAFIGGAGNSILYVTLVVIRQSLVPQHMLGRVISAQRSIVGLTAMVGTVVGGSVAGSLGIEVTIAVFSLVAMLLPVFVAWELAFTRHSSGPDGSPVG
jgi:MFS family permease